AKIGVKQVNEHYFDTPRFEVPGGVDAVARIVKAALRTTINLGYRRDGTIHVALDETVDRADINAIVSAFAAGRRRPAPVPRDAARHLAGIQPAPSLCAGRSSRRLPSDLPRARKDAGRDYRFCRRVAAAEFRRAGRARRSDGDSRLPSRSGRHGPRHRLDSGV